jgi:hypothetical protein
MRDAGRNELSQEAGRREPSLLPNSTVLAAVPAEAEWFANLDNARTRRAYLVDLRDFMDFAGIARRSKSGVARARRPQSDLVSSPACAIEADLVATPVIELCGPGGLTSPYFTDLLEPGRSNGVPHISTKQIGPIRFAHRRLPNSIGFARVQELLRLCAALRERLTERQTYLVRFAEAEVEQATSTAPLVESTGDLLATAA